MGYEKIAQAEVLTRASRVSSFPDVQLLIVVSPGEMDLYEHLTETFAGIREVAVIVERRHRDRRQQVQDVADERRQGERRLHRGKVSALGYTAVPFDVPRHQPVVPRP